MQQEFFIVRVLTVTGGESGKPVEIWAIRKLFRRSRDLLFGRGCCVFLRSPSVMTYEVLGSSLTRYLNTLHHANHLGGSAGVVHGGGSCGLLRIVASTANKGGHFFLRVTQGVCEIEKRKWVSGCGSNPIPCSDTSWPQLRPLVVHRGCGGSESQGQTNLTWQPVSSLQYHPHSQDEVRGRVPLGC